MKNDGKKCKTISSRAKGAGFEREIAALLRDAGWLNARRAQQFCGAAGDADVIGGPEGFHLECKRCETFRGVEWLAQAQAEARPGEIPVVLWRRSRQPVQVLMTFDAFVEIARLVEGGAHHA